MELAPDRKAIGRRLRQTRMLAGITQKEMVTELRRRGVEVNQTNVSRWEQRGARPRQELFALRAWAQITGTRVAYLADGQHPMWDAEAPPPQEAILPPGLEKLRSDEKLRRALRVTEDEMAFLISAEWHLIYADAADRMPPEMYISLLHVLREHGRDWLPGEGPPTEDE